jgi:hypothetical protein
MVSFFDEYISIVRQTLTVPDSQITPGELARKLELQSSLGTQSTSFHVGTRHVYGVKVWLTD